MRSGNETAALRTGERSMVAPLRRIACHRQNYFGFDHRDMARLNCRWTKIMEDNLGLRVYVLGAGCSYDEQNGYPLAKGFLSELETYAAKIHGRMDCQGIEKSVQQTVGLLKYYKCRQYQASTIDQLINLILKNQCDERLGVMGPPESQRNAALRSGAVRNAKISTAACFLDKEEQVLDRLVPKYQTSIRNIFNDGNISTPCSARLQNSNARVFTFNYDRLFELAFFGAGILDEYANHSAPYELLNSGLNVDNTALLQILEDRFCFVKLHGSIGIRCKDENMSGSSICRDGNIAKWTPPKVTDEMFFGSCVPGLLRDEPLVVFPYEKDFILKNQTNGPPPRFYIKKVWASAKKAFQNARDIFIIGYSFSDEADSDYLIELLREAKVCRQIELQNISHQECDRIRELLWNKLGFENKITTNVKPFG